MKKYLVLIVLFFCILQGLYSQIFPEDYNSRMDSTYSEGEIFLNLQASSWFYNNEYFNPFYKGYTLIGGSFQPKIVYQSNSKLTLMAGADFHRNYGKNENLFIKPLLSIEYKPTTNFSVLVGSYNGGMNHLLPEALFSFENHLQDIVEQGILIRFSNSRIKTETWLNWESFIEPGDTFREAFTAGSSNRILVFEKNSLKLSIPLNLIAHHAGGQINNNDEKVETLINANEGVRLEYNFQPKNRITLYSEFNLFQATGDYKTKNGKATSINLGMQSNHFELNAEYFQGNNFVCFAGNPILNRAYSIPMDLSDPFYFENKKMFNLKTGYRQKIGPNSFLFLRFESYYFLDAKSLDYSYSLHLQAQDFLRIFNLKR